MGETIDYDGMGDFSRFGPTGTQKRKRSKKKIYKKNIMNFLVGLGLTIPLMFFTMVL